MAREIKFRAWVDTYSRWHMTTSFALSADGSFFSGGIYSKNELEWKLLQYTGLKDKNGREIYEGDIVEYNDFNSLRTGGHTGDNIIVGQVTFGCGMWLVEEKNGHHDLYISLVNDEELEVIGNAFENPELLEVQDK